MSATTFACRHCKTVVSYTSARGLCHRCYFTGEIRDQYPTLSNPRNRKGSKRSSGVQVGNQATRPLPASPTTAMPGTPEKIAVLEQRAVDGTQLYHPQDAKDDG